MEDGDDKEWLDNYCLENKWRKPFYHTLVCHSIEENIRYVVSCRAGPWQEEATSEDESEAEKAVARAMRYRLKSGTVRCHWIIDSSLFPSLDVPKEHTSRCYSSPEMRDFILYFLPLALNQDDDDYWIIAVGEPVASCVVKYIREFRRARADLYCCNQ